MRGVAKAAGHRRKQVIVAPGFLLKGSGWYTLDFRDSNPEHNNKSENDEKEVGDAGASTVLDLSSVGAST
ncbi:hypothetical protein [Candidatus Vallotia cooleyia]|uniref:hypothetical protein n=1 Tax=Candidatus Vallotiella adelgis TaxID=1177211 RepID=UPI003B969EE8|nr:hypothetical protein GJV44_00795 [Candidatus Vallotia cooleyia]